MSMTNNIIPTTSGYLPMLKPSNGAFRGKVETRALRESGRALIRDQSCMRSRTMKESSSADDVCLKIISSLKYRVAPQRNRKRPVRLGITCSSVAFTIFFAHATNLIVFFEGSSCQLLSKIGTFCNSRCSPNTVWSVLQDT